MHMMLCEFYLVWLGLIPSPWPRYICIAAQTCWFKGVSGRKEGKQAWKNGGMYGNREENGIAKGNPCIMYQDVGVNCCMPKGHCR